MRIKGVEINDECSKCGKVLNCDLMLDGHGCGRERTRIAEMMRCQFEHRKGKNYDS